MVTENSSRAPDLRAVELGTPQGSGITLRRLQIFWVVAHSQTLTKAAKQLGLAQPSLSQQISSLEASVGAQLFERRSNRMSLTDEGGALLRLAERVLTSMQALEEGVEEIGRGDRQTLRIAGLTSVLRVLLPRAITGLHAGHPGLDFDISEGAPAEVLELLYGRRIDLGLISANAIAPATTGFHQVPVLEDPYVLAVPEHLDLAGVTDPGRDLCAADREVLNRTIQFTFGTQHTDRVQAWYDQVLPDNWSFARVRSFEVAIGMVQQGLGICLAPAMSAMVGGRAVEGVRLYPVDLPARHIVALLAPQYLRVPAYAALIAALQQAGQEFAAPAMQALPPFLQGVGAPAA